MSVPDGSHGAAPDVATAYTLDFILSALPAGALRLLEIGCGNGRLAAALQDRGLQVAALDSDPAAVEQARARGVSADRAEWPAPRGGGYDAVLFTRSLHHVHDLPGGVRAAFDALRPGGRIIVEDFAAEGVSERTDAWFRATVRLLCDAGITVGETPTLSAVLEGQETGHSHDLHTSGAIEAALLACSNAVEASRCAYHFRYLLDDLKPGATLGPALLRHEQSLIASGVIDALGRRYVAPRTA